MESFLICPQCVGKLRVPEKMRGKQVRCPHCRHEFRAPSRTQHSGKTSPKPAPAPRRDLAEELLEEEERMRDRRRDRRLREFPWYLPALAVLPWGIPILMLGGLIWAVVAGVLSSLCLGIARATNLRVANRVLILVGINVALYAAFIPIYIRLLAKVAKDAEEDAPPRVARRKAAPALPEPRGGPPGDAPGWPPAPGVSAAPAPRPERPAPPPRPAAPARPEVTHEDRTVRTVTFPDRLIAHEARFDAQHGLRTMVWDADGKSFFFLESTGQLSRLTVPTFAAAARRKLGAGVTVLSLSQEGLLATAPKTKEVLLLDPKTLAEKTRFDVPGVTRALPAPNLSFALAFGNEDTALVVDLKRKALGKPFTGRVLGRANYFGLPAISPDGKYLFSLAGGQLCRFGIGDGGELRPEQIGPAIASSNPRAIEISADGAYVAVPCGPGNDRSLPGFPEIRLYSTYLFRTSDLTRPVTALASGAYPQAVGIDPVAELVYAQNFDHPLMLFTLAGEKWREYDLGGGGTTKQFLVHPDGDHVLVLTDHKLFYVKPPPK